MSTQYRLLLGAFLFFCVVNSEAAITKGEVSLSTDTMLSQDYQLTSNKQFGFLSFQLSNIDSSKDWDFLETGLQTEVKGSLAFQSPAMSFINIPQLYVREWGLAVGRKLQTWSFADEVWHLGLFQPQFTWNPLLPESQGLTGIFLDLPAKDTEIPWGVRVFGSPIFIPDQGASYTIKNGTFQSTSPWFQAPPKYVQYDDAGKIIDQLDYEVIRPQTNDVVFNASYAAQVYVGKADSGYSMTAAVAYKPANQLALGIDGTKTASPSNVTTAAVTPKLFYHTVASVDGRWAHKGLAMGLSALNDRPMEPDFEPRWTYKPYANAFLLVPFLQYEWGAFKALVSLIDIQTADAAAKGDKVDQFGTFIPDRFPFQRAGRAELAYSRLWKKTEGIIAKSSFLVGESNQFSQWTSEVAYQVDSKWQMGGRLLLVRSENQSKNMYADFQNNDELMMGVSYAF